MLCLGLFVFSLETLSYQELQRRTTWKHASQPLVGARDAVQYLGPGEDTITLQGVVVPEFKGLPVTLNLLRIMADQGFAWMLVEATGTIYGAFVITELQETKSLFYVTGAARRIEFTITLRRVDQDAIKAFDNMLGDNLGELGSLMDNVSGQISDLGQNLGLPF
ncbi:MAG: hypothetical protein GAK30_01566 [Paracidovorax wautersii]|uniref:Phage protein U n=1 Tax=Paracidovorax wautersii TaxID=1177982 RepID=A0A7V8FPQ2_9BURK|nr:MAG: hypothetical protein GAK30_01566 [Paracidovorax wautersii]